MNFSNILKDHFALFYSEDQLSNNFAYNYSLPSDEVNCFLKLKDDLTLAGLPFFFEAFNYLSPGVVDYNKFKTFEGRDFFKSDNVTLEFKLPFNVALSGERIALNLLQRASAIATQTGQFVTRVDNKVKILDTRKTLPALRFLEKYAVHIGGGYNHRFGQTDAWMIKDNHKFFFGGMKEAINFFKSQRAFYTPLIIEIHNQDELIEAIELGENHFLLDNFSPSEIKEAIKLKKDNMTYEVSGGITLENIHKFAIEGVDAISSGSLTYNAKPVDISLKFKK